MSSSCGYVGQEAVGLNGGPGLGRRCGRMPAEVLPQQVDLSG